MQPKIPCLSMLAVHEQCLRRAGINAAYVQVESTGVNDAACRLFARVTDMLLARPIEQGTLPGLDSLHPESLSEKHYAQLAAIPALSDPGLNAENQDARFRVLRDLRGNVGSDLARELAARAHAIVHDEAERFCSALQGAYAVAPGAVREAVLGVKSALERMRLPVSNDKALPRWLNLKNIADKLRQRRAVLPPCTVKLLHETIASEVRDLYEVCLRGLALTCIVAAWGEEKSKLLRFLEDLAKRTSDVVAATTSVKKCLEDKRASVTRDQHVSRASVVKPLAGPNEDQVIAGMLAQLHAGDETALARVLLDRFETSLREVCPRICAWIGPTEPFPELLRHILPDTQANEFLVVVAQAMGPGQSLYEVLERDGIDDAVDFLYHRSEPTVDLSGRDMPQLGICPERLCIVTLPTPHGPKDCKIRDDARAAFEKIDPTCTFVDAPATDRSVTVTRLIIGFPIAIEGQTPNLLSHYLEAKKHGHRPHLFGVVPESPDGKAIDQYDALLSISPPHEREP